MNLVGRKSFKSYPEYPYAQKSPEAASFWTYIKTSPRGLLS